MIPKTEWKWFGYPGHLICANSCRFRLCTQVGDYLISTVGDYYYQDKRKTIGADKDSFFETYVFKAGSVCSEPDCGCGQPTLADGCEIDGVRDRTAGDAQRSHLEYCEKYAAGGGQNR